jgi:hypothetical protein
LVDTAINYPWNPFPGSTVSETPGSYAFITNWDHTTQDFVNNPYLERWFQGGAVLTITQQDALVLTAAGFGDCIGAAIGGPAYGPPPGSSDVYGAGVYGAGVYG